MTSNQWFAAIIIAAAIIVMTGVTGLVVELIGR